jgi:malate dehydrogenase
VKIVVVANPANTNAKILAKFAPSIPKTNITCLTRLDHNRALAQLSERSGKPTREVKNAIIWGNHSSTQYPDVNHATIGGQPARDVVGDDAYLDVDFVDVVRKRGAAIIEARKLSSALSAASSVCDHVYDWIHGTKEGEWTSMGVVSDGSYGITEGLVYSFPVTCTGGKWQIVQGLTIDERSRKLMDESAQELTEEFAVAEECLAESA